MRKTVETFTAVGVIGLGILYVNKNVHSLIDWSHPWTMTYSYITPLIKSTSLIISAIVQIDRVVVFYNANVLFHNKN